MRALKLLSVATVLNVLILSANGSSDVFAASSSGGSGDDDYNDLVKIPPRRATTGMAGGKKYSSHGGKGREAMTKAQRAAALQASFVKRFGGKKSYRGYHGSYGKPAPTTAANPAGYTVYYDGNPPKSLYEGVKCNDYHPQKVNWRGFISDVYEFLNREGGAFGPEQIPYKRYAAIFVRCGFHDVGSYKGGAGGSDGSIVLSSEEQTWGGNNAPFKFVPYARGALKGLVHKYNVSWGDAIAVAGAAAANWLNPETRLVKPFNLLGGRCESSVANPQVLPPEDINFKDFVTYWNSLGMRVSHAAALMGAHVVMEDGPNHSDGEQQYRWTNKFYTDMWAGNMSVVKNATSGEKSVSWTADKTWQYTISDAMNSPINLADFHSHARLQDGALGEAAGDANVPPEVANAPDAIPGGVDPAANNKKSKFLPDVTDPDLQSWLEEMTEYTLSNADWIDDYAIAYKRLTEVGARYTINGAYTIPGI